VELAAHIEKGKAWVGRRAIRGIPSGVSGARAGSRLPRLTMARNAREGVSAPSEALGGGHQRPKVSWRLHPAMLSGKVKAVLGPGRGKKAEVGPADRPGLPTSDLGAAGSRIQK
jgi:hypothetical protein